MRLMLALLVISALATQAHAQDSCHIPVTVNGTLSSGVGNHKLEINSARVTIYRVEPTGAQEVGSGGTGNVGQFSIVISGGACDSVLYAVANVRQEVTLAAVIGPTVPGAIEINEFTTVATAYAMAQFFNDQGAIVAQPLPARVAAGMAEALVSPTTGMPSNVIQTPPNAHQTNTWHALGTLANIVAGCVRDAAPNSCTDLFALTGTTSGHGPATTLQAMVKIARHPAVNVGPLFELGEVSKVNEPFLIKATNGPEAPDHLLRLDAFTLAVKVNATGRLDPASGVELCPFGGPGNIAFDPNGYAFITNNVVQGKPTSTRCQVVLKPNGQPADGAGGSPVSPLFGGGILGQGFGVGLDPFGHVWSGNFGWGKDNPQGPNASEEGSVSEFTVRGAPLSPDVHGFLGAIYRVQGVASDGRGNIWIAGWGNDTVEVFPLGNPKPPFVTHVETGTQPFGVAVDGDGAGWVTYEGTAALAKFTLANGELVCQFEVSISNPARPDPNNPCKPVTPANIHPKGLAIDKEGNAWAVASAADAIVAFDKHGNPLGTFQGGGVVAPWGVAVDSRDHIWVANFGSAVQADIKYRVSELCGANVADCGGRRTGAPMTPTTGYTLPSGGAEVTLHNGQPLYGTGSTIKSYKPMMRSTAVAVDMAGNLWCTNNWKPETVSDTLLGNPGGDGIVIFVGLAAPVMPVPYSAPPKAP
jgi:hypothetical protein